MHLGFPRLQMDHSLDGLYRVGALRLESGDRVRGGAYSWVMRTSSGGYLSGHIEVRGPFEESDADRFSGGVENAGMRGIAPFQARAAAPCTRSTTSLVN